MATYAELYDLLMTESELKNKVRVAVLVAAKTVADEDPGIINHTSRIVWAKEVALSFMTMADQAFPLLLAQYKAVSVAQIKSVDDATVQSAVNSYVNLLAGV